MAKLYHRLIRKQRSLVALIASSWFVTNSYNSHSVVPTNNNFIVPASPTKAKRGANQEIASATPKKKKKKATLCTVIKDPQWRYIDEWADYHMMAVGFTGLHLYDNTDNFALKDWGHNKSYAAQIKRVHYLPGITHNVTHFEYSKINSEVQSEAFMDCVRNAIEEDVDWVAGFDMDEFLVLRNHNYSSSSSSSSIIDFMDEFCQYPCGQLSFNWVMFGPHGRTNYTAVPVTKRFQISARPDWTIKGIADPKAVDQSSFWCHTFPLLPPRTWVDTDGREMNALALNRNLGLTNPAKPVDVAVLHHYKTLSEEEWHMKHCIQGKSVNNNVYHCGTSADETLPRNKDTMFDDTAWRILTSRIPEYAKYDLLGIEDLG